MMKFKNEKILYIVNYFILAIIGFVALYPFWYVLIASFSSGNAVITGEVWFYPVDVTLDSYREAISTEGIWRAYGNSIYITVAGTFVNMVCTTCGAYALSKKRLRGRVAITFMVVASMWFNPGIIPIFLNYRDLGLYNKMMAIIIGFAVVPLYLIVLRTFFQSIPQSLEESAKMDGASDFMIMSRLVVPISKPAMATITLYYAVSRWNGYFWTMILLRDKNKMPLQVLLKKIIVEMFISEAHAATFDYFTYSKETLIYTIIIISIIPVIIAYPFLQKYVVKGIMVGSLKG